MRPLRFPRGPLDPSGAVQRVLMHVDSPPRRLWALGLAGRAPDDAVVARTMVTLRETQHESGYWCSGDGERLVDETAVALLGLASVREDMRRPYVQLAADWLVAAQREDGGYGPDLVAEPQRRTTCIALLALLDAGEGRSVAAHDAAAWLSRHLEVAADDPLEILALGCYCRANRDRWNRWR